MDRRDFLQLSLMLSTSGLLTGCQIETNQGKGVERTGNEEIVVIGAGMAGLTATRKLQLAGYRVTVLEGRDRIGGRLWTSRAWPDIPLDMGASWIHGTEGNPLTDLADEIDAHRVVTDYDDGATIYDVDGVPLDQEETAEVWGQLEEILTPAIITAKASIFSDDYSIQEAVEAMMSLEEMSAEKRQRLDFFLNAGIEQDASGDSAKLSAKYAADVGEFDGDEVIFPDGYDELAYYLAQDLAIKLEHQVVRITYTEYGVVVVTNQGEFHADRVVITLPLGVLKKGAIEFDPPLPGEKQNAIEAMDVGVLNKTYLRFAEPFWPEEQGAFYHISKKKGEWTFWLNMFPYIDEPILVGFNAAQYGRAIETLSDKETVSAAMGTLRTIYGTDVPDPEAWQITRWASDPFAYGSYSFTAVGTNDETRVMLAKPVNGRLFFAGEATSADYPATVHGAHLSGLRAAEELKEYLY